MFDYLPNNKSLESIKSQVILEHDKHKNMNLEIKRFKKNQHFYPVKKQILLLLGLIFILFFTSISLSLAHSPHDVIEDLDLVTNYQEENTLFIIVRGNLFKSNNSGNSWQRIVRGIDNQAKLSSLDISNNNQTLFLSTFGSGIYKSDNQGLSWQKTVDKLNIDSIYISPNNSNFVLAQGTEKGLYKTDNGGKTWQKIIDNIKVTSISYYPKQEEKIMIGDNQGNIYISNDAGLTWKKNTTINGGGKIRNIVFSPYFATDNTFFIATEKQGILRGDAQTNSFENKNNGITDKNIQDLVIIEHNNSKYTIFASTWNQGFFISNNQGDSWQNYSQGLTKEPQASQEKFYSPHFSKLGISKGFVKDKTIFLAGFDGLFKTTNAGVNWQQIETLSPRHTIALSISPNYAQDNTIAVATYNEELYLSKNQGKSWIPINRGFNQIRYNSRNKKNFFYISKPRFYAIEFSPDFGSDNTLFLAQSYKFFISEDRGKNWKNIPLKVPSGSSLRQIMIIPSPNFKVDNTIYLATVDGGAIYKSTDRGKHFSVVSVFGKYISRVIISPDFANDQTLYACGAGIYKTTDAGKTWQSLINDPDLTNVAWKTLAISPDYKNDQTVIAGTNRGIFISHNKGKNWSQLSLSISDNIINIIEAIAVSPNYDNDQTFIVVAKGKGLFKTIDGGDKFTLIGQDLIDKNYIPYNLEITPSTSIPLKFSPFFAKDNTIFAFGSANAEFFKSTDGGNNWKIIQFPKTENFLNKLLTYLRGIKLVMNIYPFLRWILAFACALFIYIILGYCQLERKLNIGKYKMRLGIFLIVFLGTVTIFSL